MNQEETIIILSQSVKEVNHSSTIFIWGCMWCLVDIISSQGDEQMLPSLVSVTMYVHVDVLCDLRLE